LRAAFARTINWDPDRPGPAHETCAIGESLQVPKSAASLVVVLGMGMLSLPGAVAQPFAYPPNPVAWVVAPGYSGFSGYPWPGPPFARPIQSPAYGCYVSRSRLWLKGAWREIEVCS
jgi:hypothetical protein